MALFASEAPPCLFVWGPRLVDPLCKCLVVGQALDWASAKIYHPAPTLPVSSSLPLFFPPSPAQALTARFCRSNPSIHCPPPQHQPTPATDSWTACSGLWLLAEKKHPGNESTQLTTPRSSSLISRSKPPCLESARRAISSPLRRHKTFAVLEAFTPNPKYTEDTSFRQVSLSIPSKWSSKFLSLLPLPPAAAAQNLIEGNPHKHTQSYHGVGPPNRTTKPFLNLQEHYQSWGLLRH